MFFGRTSTPVKAQVKASKLTCLFSEQISRLALPNLFTEHILLQGS